MRVKPYQLVAKLIDEEGGAFRVAKAMGEPSFQGTLHKFAAGNVSNPIRRNAEKIAKHFGIPLDAIYDEEVSTQVAETRLGVAPREAPPMEVVAAREASPDYDVPSAPLPPGGALLGQLVTLAAQLDAEHLQRLLIYANDLANAGNTTPSAQDPYAGKRPRTRAEPRLIRDLHRAEDQVIRWVPAGGSDEAAS
jgi:hypothetical protein